MSDREILQAIADALDAATSVLRQHIALMEPPAASDATSATRSAVERARAMHPQLGPRQAEVIEELAKAGINGTGTGAIASAIDYNQTDVYLTLKSLLVLGFAEKDASKTPHIYQLGEQLRDERWPDQPNQDVA